MCASGKAFTLLDAILFELQVFRMYDGRVDEVEAKRVGAIGIEDVHGVGVVLEALGHLTPVLREHQTVADEVLEGGLVEQARGEDHECVEPSTGLVDSLGDEIRRKGCFKRFLVLKRVVTLQARKCVGLSQL